MQKLIEKHIKGTIKNKQQCVEALKTAGLRITDENKLEFAGTRSFTTHSGRNRFMLFTPLLKGKISIDIENRFVKWNLNLRDIVAKTLSTFVIIVFVWQWMMQGIWINSLMLGVLSGGLVFLLNWINLHNELDRLTSEMIVK